jgi:hypothetical protein
MRTSSEHLVTGFLVHIRQKEKISRNLSGLLWSWITVYLVLGSASGIFPEVAIASNFSLVSQTLRN